MTQVEDAVVALLERKASDVQQRASLPSALARSAERARRLRYAAKAALTLAPLLAVSVVVPTFVVGEKTTSPPASTHGATRTNGAYGSTEWELTTSENGREHCLDLQVKTSEQDSDGSRTCGVFAAHGGDPDLGPSFATVDAGNKLVLFGETGAAVKKVSFSSATQQLEVTTIPLEWDTAPASGFYIFFLDRTSKATVATYDENGTLLKRTKIKIADDNVRAPQ